MVSPIGYMDILEHFTHKLDTPSSVQVRGGQCSHFTSTSIFWAKLYPRLFIASLHNQSFLKVKLATWYHQSIEACFVVHINSLSNFLSSPCTPIKSLFSKPYSPRRFSSWQKLQEYDCYLKRDPTKDFIYMSTFLHSHTFSLPPSFLLPSSTATEKPNLTRIERKDSWQRLWHMHPALL